MSWRSPERCIHALPFVFVQGNERASTCGNSSSKDAHGQAGQQHSESTTFRIQQASVSSPDSLPPPVVESGRTSFHLLSDPLVAWLESFPPFGEGDGLDDDEYMDQDRGVFYGPSDTDDFNLWLDRRRQLQPGPLLGLDARRFSEQLLEGPARYRALYGDVESLLWASGMDPGDSEADVWFGDGRDFADHYLVGGVVDCEVLDMLGYDSVSMAVAGMGAHADTYTGTTVGHTSPAHGDRNDFFLRRRR